MRWMLLLALLVPQDTPREKEIENKISSVKITVDFQNAALPEIIGYIREIADFNVLIDRRVDGIEEELVSIKVQNLTVKSILKLVLTPRGYGYTYQDDVLLITSIENLNKKLVLELYDIRDLLHPIQNFPGVDIQLAQDGGTFLNVDDPEVPETLPVEELVQTHTGQGFWDENADAGVSLNNGILVVKATKEVHKQVRRLLNVLRRNK